MQIPVDKICPDPRRTTHFSRSEIRRTASRMQKCFGAPLCVAQAPACDIYMLISDERRFRAALLLGLKFVPCEVYDVHIVSSAKAAVGDPRFLINSIDRLIDTSRRVGIDAKYEKHETSDGLCLTVTVRRT